MGELAKIDSFRKELAIAETIDHIKLIGDSAQAYQFILKRQNANKEKIDEIGEFDIEVECKKAEWLDQFYPASIGKMGTKREPIKMPVSKKESARAKKINKYQKEKPEIINEIKEKIKKDKNTILNAKSLSKELNKKEREDYINQQKKDIETGVIKAPKGLFDVLIIDPPWNYGRKYDPAGSRVANPYPEMGQEELLNLKIPANDNCILWLWTTHQFIWDAKELMSNWGFEYKATLVWNKENIGMGYWLRMQCEFCLLGIKGKPIWDNTTYRDIINEKGREHSRKPNLFYDMVKEVCMGNKLDYFSREKREGFENYGNEINKFTNGMG